MIKFFTFELNKQILKVINSIENNKNYVAGLFVLCLITRVLTHISYIEDIDSMRFALGVQDYDVANYQPHFPAYPVYCFLVKIIYIFSGNLGVSFSIIGAIATFGLAYKLPHLISKHHNLLLSLFIIFNPLLWLMSNRFMPGLLGLSMAVLALVYFKKWFENGNKKDLIITVLSISLLAGIRLSYIPIVLLPCVYILLTGFRNIKLVILIGLIGVGVWLVPLIIDTGWNKLIEVAQNQTNGHFNEFGGTVINEPGLLKRLTAIFIYSWSDGMGGWMPDRNWTTLLLSVIIILPLLYSLKKITTRFKKSDIIIIGSVIIYLIWALFFQNVLYKSRHILPLIPFIILAYYIGIKSLFQERIIYKYFVVLTISVYMLVSVPLTIQHRQPTAIEKAVRYIESMDSELIVVGPKLMQKRISLIQKRNISYQLDTVTEFNSKQVLSFAEMDINGMNLILDTTFYHNPYVNRMWSQVNIFHYKSLEIEK